MGNTQQNYLYGYKQAMQGNQFRPELVKYTGYEDGWIDGNRDVWKRSCQCLMESPLA